MKSNDERENISLFKLRIIHWRVRTAADWALKFRKIKLFSSAHRPQKPYVTPDSEILRFFLKSYIVITPWRTHEFNHKWFSFPVHTRTSTFEYTKHSLHAYGHTENTGKKKNDDDDDGKNAKRTHQITIWIGFHADKMNRSWTKFTRQSNEMRNSVKWIWVPSYTVATAPHRREEKEKNNRQHRPIAQLNCRHRLKRRMNYTQIKKKTNYFGAHSNRNRNRHCVYIVFANSMRVLVYFSFFFFPCLLRSVRSSYSHKCVSMSAEKLLKYAIRTECMCNGEPQMWHFQRFAVHCMKTIEWRRRFQLFFFLGDNSDACVWMAFDSWLHDA